MANNPLVEKLRKMVVKAARKTAPTKKPAWAFFFAGLGVSLIISMPPGIRYAESVPLVGDFLRMIPLWPFFRVGILAFFGGYVGLWTLRFSCRGLQLCFPEELEAFEVEREVNIG